MESEGTIRGGYNGPIENVNRHRVRKRQRLCLSLIDSRLNRVGRVAIVRKEKGSQRLHIFYAHATVAEMPIGFLEQVFLRRVVKIGVKAVRHLHQKLSQDVIGAGHLTKGPIRPVPRNNMARLQVTGMSLFLRKKFPKGDVARDVPKRIDRYSIDCRLKQR